MSVQIAVSYETPEELNAITQRLADLDLSISKAYISGSKYRRVYFKGTTARAPRDKAHPRERVPQRPPLEAGT